MYSPKLYIVKLCWILNITKNCEKISQNKHTSLEIPVGTMVTGVIKDESYNITKQKYLESSFTVRYQNYLSPRVSYLSKGVYEFKSFLNDIGFYNLEIRLDFQNSFGTCRCNVRKSVILFQNIANVSINIVQSPRYLPKQPTDLPNECRWLFVNASFNCIPYFRKWDWLRLPDKKNYWVHIDGDSTLQRGEVEDLIFELSNHKKYIVINKNVTCIDFKKGVVKEKKRACGNIHSVGLRKIGDYVNLFKFYTKDGKKITISLATYTGLGKILSKSQWASLFGYMYEKKRPDTIILNYALHFAHRYNCKTNNYIKHVENIFYNIREVYDGNLLWHPGLTTHFENSSPYGSVNERTLLDPPEARTVKANWKCRTKYKMYRMRDDVSVISKKFNVTILKETLDISSVRFFDTNDNRHFDGGIYNKLNQKTTINTLNYMLGYL